MPTSMPSSGSSRASSSAAVMTGSADSAGNVRPPPKIASPGYRASSISVTMPKSPPPPRSAQMSSASSASLTRCTTPAASTSSTEMIERAVMPYRRLNIEWPPAIASATTLTSGFEPASAMRPVPSSSSSARPQFTPAPARSTLACVSTASESNRVGRTSTTPRRSPFAPWPLGCTVTPSPAAVAARRMACTSARSAGSAIAAGRWSTLRFHGMRAASYSASSGSRSVPVSSARRERSSDAEVIAFFSSGST